MVATGGVPTRIATGAATSIVTTVMTMRVMTSEQQADYDTTSDTEHTEPTPGHWRTWQAGVDPLINEECVLAEVADREEPLLVAELNRTANEHTDFPGHWKANARLIAAAGTAASVLPEEYDPVKAVKALPSLIAVLKSVERADATKKEEIISHAKQVLDTLRTDATADSDR
jgi:hypothetical protein